MPLVTTKGTKDTKVTKMKINSMPTINQGHRCVRGHIYELVSADC
jgi:hypothetical protein